MTRCLVPVKFHCIWPLSARGINLTPQQEAGRLHLIGLRKAVLVGALRFAREGAIAQRDRPEQHRD